MARLVLWDVDGTLVRVGPVGAEVFDRALEGVLGRPPTAQVVMGGKTDPQIVREYLEIMEVDGRDQHLPSVLRQLEAELAQAASLVAEGGRALPGVTDVLQRLAVQEGVIQSVLTGNIAPNAVVKVTAFGLERWLDLEVGAFGSDDADREALVPIALERVTRLRGVRLAPGDVWVVGDTAHDLACARAGGAHCLLVGTGHTPAAELEALGADAAVADLTDTDMVVKLLTGQG